jgi:hypothetical protein
MQLLQAAANIVSISGVRKKSRAIDAHAEHACPANTNSGTGFAGAKHFKAVSFGHQPWCTEEMSKSVPGRRPNLVPKTTTRTSPRLASDCCPRRETRFLCPPSRPATWAAAWQLQPPNYHCSSSVRWHAGPNPAFKRSANGRPPRPGVRYAVQFRTPGLGVLPSSPA